MINTSQMNHISIEELKGTDRCRILGRTDMTQVPLPLFWNYSGIDLKILGGELWLDVEIDWSNRGPWIAWDMNGSTMAREYLLPGRQLIPLVHNSRQDSVKNIRFYREMQPRMDDPESHILIHGVYYTGELLPVDQLGLKIEFIGDSITSGEGTYGAQIEDESIDMFLSASKGYPRTVGYALNADVRLVSMCGWGILSSWNNETYRRIPRIYNEVCGPLADDINRRLGAQKENDWQAWQPDVVVVNLGTNDCIAFDQPACVGADGVAFEERRNPDGTMNSEDTARLKRAVIDFVKNIRTKNPKAHIVWVYGMYYYELSRELSGAIDTYINETGDGNVFYLGLPVSRDEYIGSHGHPGVKAHERAAMILIDYLRGKFE